MIDFGLSDEEIWGKEPSFEEQALNDEIKKLKTKLMISDDILDEAIICITKINEIIKPAIETNIRKTNYEHSVPVIKSYRESLLVLREIEKELNKYYERTSSSKLG